MVVTTIMKYVLHTIDLNRTNPWENKTVYLLYTELVTGKRTACGILDAKIAIAWMIDGILQNSNNPMYVFKLGLIIH